MTLLFLGARAVMDIGGACASGGPYVPRVECPEGVPLVIVAGFWGGLFCLGLYARATSKHGVPKLVAFAWPALFLSLGWNFFEYGIDPPFGEGLVWGWLICGVLFAAMGGFPLFWMAKPVLVQFARGGPDAPPQAQVLVPTKRKVKELRAVAKAGSQPQQPAPAPQASGPAPQVSDSGDERMVDELERLSALHGSGALSADEYERAKRRILQGDV